jgi:RNA polymerase sigma-70 factor (ECF subfamily)
LDDADELLRRCQRGEESALAAIVRLFEGRIFRLACRVLGDVGLAEEATADALARVWSRAGQWRGDAAAATWVYQVAYRAVLDARKRQRRWWRLWSAPPGEEVCDPRPGPPERAAAAEGDPRLRDALGGLSAEDRALVHLYYFEERGLAEIAAILGVGRPALKMRLARARQKLRDLLKDFDEQP